MNTNLQAFYDIDRAARFYPGEEPKPAASGAVSGRVVEIKYIVVNRKCYDNFATPTCTIKIDGKRVSRAKAIQLFQ